MSALVLASLFHFQHSLLYTTHHMATVSELLRSCLAQLTSLISSAALSRHPEEVALQEWKDERGRLRVWAANIGAH